MHEAKHPCPRDALNHQILDAIEAQGIERTQQQLLTWVIGLSVQTDCYKHKIKHFHVTVTMEH